MFTGVGAIGASNSYCAQSVGPGGWAPTAFNFNVGSLLDIGVAGATLGFSGQETVVAFFVIEAHTSPVAYFWAPFPEVSGVPEFPGPGSPYVQPRNLDHGPVVVSAGLNPRLAGGPAGLFLLSEDSGATASSPYKLDVRKWGPTAHAFGAPTLVATVPSGVGSNAEGGFTEDTQSGALYVAWPAAGPAGSYVMNVWVSRDGGKTFAGPTAVGTFAFGYASEARMAMTGGKGFLTWQDYHGLALVDLSS